MASMLPNSDKQRKPMVPSSNESKKNRIVIFITILTTFLFMFWCLYKAINGLIVPVDSSYFAGYFYLAIFLVTLCFPIYLLILYVPCCSYFYDILTAKAMTVGDAVCSGCQERYDQLMEKKSKLCTKLLVKYKLNYHVPMDLTDQAISNV